MPAGLDDGFALERLHRKRAMEEEETEAGPSDEQLSYDGLDDEDPVAVKHDETSKHTYGGSLDRRVKRKLDLLLLPFLAALFLLNSLDKSNIGNAETAGFTRDAGLEEKDLNISMGYFFAFFVALQPVGAACGRKFGMTRWVPACMSLWGFCTLLHMWVRERWQLILLRIAIACLEAGFYPTTVSYLSLFYTRYEFGVRLGFFYGQAAVAGVLGAILSWAIFNHFEGPPPGPSTANIDRGWKSWEVLFLIEGCMTMVIAFLGFWWLPRSADTAWFFNWQERIWAEQRIRLDHDGAMSTKNPARLSKNVSNNDEETADDHLLSRHSEEAVDGEAHHRLLDETEPIQRSISNVTGTSITADAGLSMQDVVSAVLNYKIWHILAVNMLSAIPATAFGVFLPLVVKQLSPSLNLSPSASNILSAPPFAFGAVMLFVFTRWSDRSKQRLIPIFWGLGLLLIGLTATVLIPMSSYVLRYISLCILLSGSFIASPLTVAWLTNNTPEPGKRAIVLGINGYGNLAGVFLSVLFTPDDKKNGYIRPFIITLLCALASFAGYVAFRIMLLRENRWRENVVAGWSEDEKEREERLGDMPIPLTVAARAQRHICSNTLARGLGLEEGRRGDEKLTYRYGL